MFSAEIYLRRTEEAICEMKIWAELAGESKKIAKYDKSNPYFQNRRKYNLEKKKRQLKNKEITESLV